MRILAALSCFFCLLTIAFSVIDHQPFNTYEGYISAAIWAFLFAVEYDPRR